ncbi:MAG: cold-shock protein [Alphaproteobacteria bacterium]|nr:cold-shock protein [Alphaproteobacteria bacterium]MBV9373005.1 cold-shock protein [Alphaproteobacteria bacterium]MBV9901372.1 cold-shock protein [Alphaproteobacteria bacterium]
MDDKDSSRPKGGASPAAPASGRSEKAVGTVKFFNSDKGYGFIQPEGQREAFVHISGLEAGASSAKGLTSWDFYRKLWETEAQPKLGRSGVTGSFALPNGERIGTVRRDVMDRALGRSPGER